MHNKVSRNITIRTLSGNSFDYANTSTFVGGEQNQITAVIAPGSGDLTLSRGGQNITCDSKTIFFVPNNLTIEPSFINANNASACLFVVGGTTTIGLGTNRADNTDLVEAFIVTNRIATISNTLTAEDDTLRFVGGIVTNSNGIAGTGSTNEFRRNVTRYISGDAPSEEVIYEGGRYIDLFGSVLNQSIVFSIQEKKYLDAYVTPTP